MDCFQKKTKKNSTAFRVVPVHQLSSCDMGGGPGTGAYGSAQVPFSLRAENDKFNKLKTPLWSTYGIKHT